MKKLLSLLIALCMALTGAAAMAEEPAPAAGQSVLSMRFDRDFITAYAGMMDPAGSQETSQLVTAALDLLENAQLAFTMGEDCGVLELHMGETPVANISVSGSQETVTLVSSLFPHYAVSVDPQALSSMIDTSVNGSSVSQEEMEALLSDLTAYVNDLSAYGEKMLEGVTVSEDDSTAVLTVNTHQSAELLELLLNRLRDDAVLLPYIEMALAQENETMENFLAQAQSAIDELKNAQAADVAQITMSLSEDGGTSLEADLSGMMFFSFDEYTDNGADCTELMLIANAGNAPVEDWAGVYNGVMDGTNSDATVLGVNIAAAETETSATFYMVGEGQTVALYTYNVLMADDATGTVLNVLQLGLDLTGEGNPVASLQIVSGMVDEAPAAPSLEGLTVIDAMNATEEEFNALSMDVISYGLPSLMSNMQTAAPDQVAQLLQLIMAMQQPEDAPVQ